MLVLMPCRAAAESLLRHPTTPVEALAALRAHPDLELELVAAEPLVVDPIAIEFGTDGRLWVVEMRDYPMGMDGNWKPGGVIKVLDDTDGDGRYDKATVFMDGVAFPSGVMPWKKGALVCTAPDILYGEDTDGDGRADVVKKILTGFVTDNYQARVNSLTLGLDNWIHAANGLRGGVIRGQSASAQPIDIRGRDLRFRPDADAFEPVSGLTQFGRVRDDWGNWFGCNNTRPLLHFPLPDQYIKRNPHVAAPSASVSATPGSLPTRVYPVSLPLERFNEPGSLNTMTSGCGLGLYRDDLLGAEYAGDAFICEPVHNLVTRLKVMPRGVTFTAGRAAGEAESEFLASSSLWFTPVQSRPGPDGALWVVDMVRPITEHPRFIPPERLARLDPRAGENQGRIFRVSRRDAPRRPIRDLTTLPLPELVAALETPNGIARDLAHLELMFRADRATVPLVEKLFRASQSPTVRVQALAVLDALGGITIERVLAALRDAHPGVRRFALRLAERFLRSPSPLDAQLPALAHDADFGVRYQFALSVGEWHEASAGSRLLGQIVTAAIEDPWMRSATISAATKDPMGVLRAVLADDAGGIAAGKLAADLIATALATTRDPDAVLIAAAPPGRGPMAGWRFIALAGLQDALDTHKFDLAGYKGARRGQAMSPALTTALDRIQVAYTEAAGVARDTAKSGEEREAAVRLLASGFNTLETHLPLLLSILETSDSVLMPAVVQLFRRSTSPAVPGHLLAHWSRFPPSLRSTVVDILVSRNDAVSQLLDTIERGTVSAAGISAATRQRLLRHRDDDVRLRAEALFAAAASPDRRKVIDGYAAVRALTGDVDRGVHVFANACGMCHVFVGKSMGPPLVTFRNKSIDDFLTAILDPDAGIEPKYTGYMITTKDGRSLAGVIHSESATSFTLMLPGNLPQDVLRSDVASMSALDRSLMPEGLEGALTPQAMADLIAYITAFRETAGSAPR